MKQYEIAVEGMGCDHCIRSVRGALEELGAKVQDVQLGKAVFEFDGSEQAIRDAIEEIGFDVTGVTAK